MTRQLPCCRRVHPHLLPNPNPNPNSSHHPFILTPTLTPTLTLKPQPIISTLSLTLALTPTLTLILTLTLARLQRAGMRLGRRWLTLPLPLLPLRVPLATPKPTLTLA